MSEKCEGLTKAQKVKVEKLFHDVWNRKVYDKVLTKAQRTSPSAMKAIAFDMESMLEGIAASFGLGGMA